MACECEIVIPFGDTATIEFSQDPQTGEITANFVGDLTGFTCADLNGCKFGDLGNVNVEGATAGQILQFDGAEWVPVDPPTGGTDGCCNTSGVATENGTGEPAITIFQANGVPITIDLCSFVAPGGATAQRSGHFYDACQPIDLAGAADPETVAPAADFVEWWRQGFINGVTGNHEYWIVLADTNGALQWHQLG